MSRGRHERTDASPGHSRPRGGLWMVAPASVGKHHADERARRVDVYHIQARVWPNCIRVGPGSRTCAGRLAWVWPRWADHVCMGGRESLALTLATALSAQDGERLG